MGEGERDAHGTYKREGIVMYHIRRWWQHMRIRRSIRLAIRQEREHGLKPMTVEEIMRKAKDE